MSQSGGAATTPVPTGNTYDKYGSSNPVVRRLMAAFERDLGHLFGLAEPASVLSTRVSLPAREKALVAVKSLATTALRPRARAGAAR